MISRVYNRLTGRDQTPAPSPATAPAGMTAEEPKPDENFIRVIRQIFQSVSATEQRILNDDSVYAVYNLFSDILLGAGWRFEGDDAEAYAEVTDRITQANGFSQLLDEIAAAPFQRYGAAEILWDTSEGWYPESYRVLPAESTSFDLDERSRIERAHVTTTAGMQDLSPANFVVHNWRPTFKHPLGQSVYDRLKEVIDFKRRADYALIRYIERLSAPAVVGYYAPGTPKDKQRELLNALKDLQAASVGILPGPKGDNGNSIDLLEAKGEGGPIGVALEMLRMYERRIARAVLGSVLAIFESEFGTRAQATVHLDVLKAVVESYQADIEHCVQVQLVDRTISYNRGDPKKVDVRFKLNAPDFTDKEKMGRWIADLAQAGVIEPEQDAEQLRNLFGLETPEGWKPAEPEPVVVPGGGGDGDAAAGDGE